MRTPAELDALHVERLALNVRVARLLGWTKLDQPFATASAVGMHPNGRDYGSVPLFSERIGAAWEVLEWLRTQGWDVQLCGWTHDPTWCCLLGKGADEHEGRHESAAGAICEAALATVQEQP